MISLGRCRCLWSPRGRTVLAVAFVSGALWAALAASGSLDATFGLGGKVVSDFGGDEYAEALVLQPDGKLVAAGVTFAGMGLARYNPDGALDPTFGDGGFATAPFDGIAAACALVRQPDGKLVTGGSVYGGSYFKPTLVRYHADGSLDSNFRRGRQGDHRPRRHRVSPRDRRAEGRQGGRGR